ncbi:MAG: hypothetical protein QM715_12420 [Nibricoccus sp.]
METELNSSSRKARLVQKLTAIFADGPLVAAQNAASGNPRLVSAIGPEQAFDPILTQERERTPGLIAAHNIKD